jgi:hypothetical protein
MLIPNVVFQIHSQQLAEIERAIPMRDRSALEPGRTLRRRIGLWFVQLGSMLAA